MVAGFCAKSTTVVFDSIFVRTQLKLSSAVASPMILLFFFITPVLYPIAISARQEEYQVQTAFIYQFTKYIVWKKDPDGSEFKIAVVGRSEISNHLKDLALKKKVNERSITVKEVSATDSLKNFHIVYVAEAGRVAEVTQKVKGHSVLTIGHGESLAKKGLVINFFIDDEKVKFEINRKAAEDQFLEISSQLLKLARIVE